MILKVDLNESYSIDLGYKGGRKYVHGTDLYNSISNLAKQIIAPEAWVKSLIINKMIHMKCVIKFNIVKHDKVAGKFIISNNKDYIEGFVIETNNSIVRHYAYDERSIYSTILLTGSRADQTFRTKFSSIEEVVAITKYLHNKIYPALGKIWVFSKLKLTKRFNVSKDTLYSVKVKQNLGNRMTLSEIKENDQFIGEIVFTAMDV